MSAGDDLPMNVLRFETDPHTAVQSLLPWYLTGRLDADETAQVDAHLAGCARCREDLAFETRLRTLQPELEPVADVDHGWAALRARIDAESPRRQPVRSWLRWLVGGQAAMIAALLVLLLLPHAALAPQPEVYRALGTTPSPAASAANAIVMFRPDATEAQLRSALRASGAHLVGGPTATNAYLLNLPPADPARAIALLRSQPGVTLAESLDAGSSP